jgi:Domain of unknown function (DUF222)
MPQDPFPDPDPGPDGEEPASSPLPPAAGDGPGPDNDWDGPAEQGLYMCLPAGQVTLAGFAQNGEADTMAPGPLLATIVDTVTGEDGGGLGGCSDDQLMGIISAARRMAARAEWTSMAAMREFAARRPARRGVGGGTPAEFAADELAFELHLTPLSAAEQIDFACTVARRLPATFAALAAGQIHAVHVRIIEDETRFLSDVDAAEADRILSQQAPGLTFGELRHAAHKLLLKLDPEAARKRKEAARGEAHVRRFREASGNAGMVARELPSDEVLASWQHVEQRALDLRAAGMPGTLQELRVRAYLDLLQERDSRGQSDAPSPPMAEKPPRPAPQISPRPAASRLTGPAPVPASDRTDPTSPAALTTPAAPAVPAVPAAPAAPVPARVLPSARAWPRWSPSPSPGPPSKAGPRRPGRPTGSAPWTATTPATWPPPRLATRPPGGASPR